MKLNVLFQDSHSVRMDLINAQINKVTPKRLVRVDLTPEQIKQLKPKYVGRDSGVEIFEDINTIWLED